MGQIPNGTILRISVDVYINPAIENDADPIAAITDGPAGSRGTRDTESRAPCRRRAALPTTPRWKGSSGGSRSSSSMAATGRDGRSMVSWMLSMNTSIGITRRGSSYHWEEWVLCDTEDHWGLERVRFLGHQVKGERCSI